MRTFATVLSLILIAAAAQAGVIADIQQGLVAEGTLVQVQGAVVTGTTSSGCFITELPVGPYSGIWVYLGSGHTVVVGDVVDLTGLYEEYYELSEINVGGAGDDGVYAVVGNGSAPAPFSLTAAELVADSEAYESVPICVTDGLMVLDVPNSFGEWMVESIETGDQFMLDDFWYDDTTVLAGQCYNHACGVLNFSFGDFKLEAYADGIEVVDCTVATETSTLTEIKGLFR